MASNLLSQAGLVAEGMNAGAQASQVLDEGERNAVRSSMGLEDLARQRGEAARMRGAVAGASPEEGLLGIYKRAADAAKQNGNLEALTTTQQAMEALAKSGHLQLAQDALSGVNPRQAEAQLRAKLGAGAIAPGTLEYARVPQKDPATGGDHPNAGDIFARYKDQAGQDRIINASEVLRLATKPDVHGIPAGGSALVTGPGRQPQIIDGKTKTYAPSQGVIHVERTSEDGGKKTYAYDMEKKTWIGGAPPGEHGAPPEASGSGHIRKNLPVLKAVDEAISKVPGTVNKMDMSDPLHPYYEWTPKGQIYATTAQKLYLANPALAPEVIREIVTDPQTVISMDGTKLRHKGKVYVLGEGGGQATPAAASGQSAPTQAAPVAPAAAPAAPAAAPKPAAKPAEAPKPAAPAAQADVRKAESPAATDDSDLPAVASAGGGSARERHESRVAEESRKQEAARKASQATKAEKDAKTAVENFRVIAAGNTMSARDIPVIEQAIGTGKLTAEEQSKARRMLAKLRG